MAKEDQTEEIIQHKPSSDEANKQTRSNHSEEDEAPKYRQPSAYVQENPNAARDPKRYKKHQKVWVYRDEDGHVTATVVRVRETEQSWEYQLEDSKKQIIWINDPTWFSEADLDRWNAD